MLEALFILILVPGVISYGSGPLSSVCGNMVPGHGEVAQSSEPPYIIKFQPDKTTYSDSEEIQVTLEGKDNTKFRGFMIQARPDANTYTTYGSMSKTPNNTKNVCISEGAGKNVAITHNEGSDKTSITFTWRAPATDVGNITFVYTVVQVKATFWVKAESHVLTYKPGAVTEANTAPSQTTKTQTDSQTDVPTTLQPNQINRDPACDLTKGCFPAPSDCTTNCDYLVTWRESGIEDVEFTLQRKTAENNYWIAIGLSDDSKMGNDSVTECVSTNGVVDVKISFNSLSETSNMLSNIRPDNNDQFGVRLQSGSYRDGILRCTFTRKKTAVLASSSSGRRRRATQEESIFFDLTEEWYLLVAHGIADSGNKNKHTDDPTISTSKIDFLTVSTDTGTTPAMGESGTIKKDSRCGKSVGCYHDCGSSDSCGFLLTWMENGDDIDFTLTCKRGSNSVYCAIGLSKDNKMGDDSVFECVSSDGTVSVFVSYNDGRNNYRLKMEKFGVSKITAVHEDGILKCTFSRKKTFDLASARRKKRAVDATTSTFFDMNDDFNLLYAYGTAIGGNLNKHQMRPKVSSQKADFQSFTDLSASAISKPQIKLHGILMMFAWLFFANFGIFMARFYKTVWPEGMEWCAQKRWFILHRSFMVTAFLLTVASFIVIFVHVGGYAKIEGNNFEKSHPIIGIVVMCLATINPIMALFRPHPGTPKRPYFNFAHISVGVTAYVCAVVNMFSGFDQSAADVPFSAKIVVWIYLGWVGLIELTSYIYDCQTRRGHDEGTSPILGYNSSKGEAYEMKSSAADHETVHQNVSRFKIGILCIHAVVLLSLVIAGAVIVGMGETEDKDDM